MDGFIGEGLSGGEEVRDGGEVRRWGLWVGRCRVARVVRRVCLGMGVGTGMGVGRGVGRGVGLGCAFRDFPFARGMCTATSSRYRSRTTCSSCITGSDTHTFQSFFQFTNQTPPTAAAAAAAAAAFAIGTVFVGVESGRDGSTGCGCGVECTEGCPDGVNPLMSEIVPTRRGDGGRHCFG